MSSSIARLDLNLTVKDASGLTLARNRRFSWQPGADKVEQVTIASATFQALSPPSGAHAVLIFVEDAPSLVLKGVTGDTGVALTPSSGAIKVPAVLPINSPSLGIYNGGASSATVEVVWM